MLNGNSILKNQAKIFFKSNFFPRSKYSSRGFELKTLVPKTSVSNLHQSQATDYAITKDLPLPLNIEDLASSEKLKFSPQRSRDINGSFISSSTLSLKDVQSDKYYPLDDRMECYDCSGVINLSSVMKINVPFPFVSRGKLNHLHVFDEQWGQNEKYVSEELNKVHHMNMRQSQYRNITSYLLGSKDRNKIFHFCFPNKTLKFYNDFQSTFSFLRLCQFRNFCSMKEKVETTEKNINKNINKMTVPQFSQKEKFKVAVRDYGSVFLVYYISVSLLSLGCCYVMVASGIDLSYILKEFGADEGATAAGTAAHFVIAYTVHKVLAPARVALTLTTIPFIVKKLRKIGILKAPKPKME